MALTYWGPNGQLYDTKTGRIAYYGPNGEPGYADNAGNNPRAVRYQMPDGRTSWYIPGTAQSEPAFPTTGPGGAPSGGTGAPGTPPPGATTIALTYWGSDGVLYDSRTGRRAYYGPGGEPGYADNSGNNPNAVAYRMPDGRTAWYIPGTGQSGTAFPLKASESGDARAIIQSVLRGAGLESLTQWAWDQIAGGASVAQIQLLLQDRPEYKQRFAGNTQRQSAGLPVLSPAEYMNLEENYRSLLRQSGLPPGFYDQSDDFNGFIGQGISPAELSARILDGYKAAMQADPMVRAELMRRVPGLTEGGMAAYFLDESRALPIIEKELMSSRIGAAAVRSGYGQLGVSEADLLYGYGVTEDQARQGFGDLALDMPLYTPLNASEGAIDRETQMQAAFANNAQGRAAINKRRRTRQAAFETAGQFGGGAQGSTGVGQAR